MCHNSRGGFFRAAGCSVGFWMLLGCWCGSASAQGKQTLHANHGQTLFEHVWQEKYDGRAGGDGLGPLFNERSCIACHNQGGIGGAGPNKSNVTLLTVMLPDMIDGNSLERLRLSVMALHPGFENSRSIVLHRYSINRRAYANFCEKLLGLTIPAGDDPIGRAVLRGTIDGEETEGPIKTVKIDGNTFKLSQRSTTPLFGLGLVDTIPQAEIEAVAALETAENPKVHGRFIGRFGWRGQIMDLNSFNRGACATELGLAVSSQNQTADPSALASADTSSAKLDLTDVECDEMTQFVGRLPAPRQLKGSDRGEEKEIKAGQRVFSSAGCAVCHRPTLGAVHGIYSDLLVYDLGEGLTDPSPAPSTPLAALVPVVTIKYYSTLDWQLSTEATRAFQQMWRTPPLWGLRDSGPYLHDGRAATVAEAILAHGGEAEDSVQRYAALPLAERSQLLTFLSTLAAPDPAKLPKLREEQTPATVEELAQNP